MRRTLTDSIFENSIDNSGVGGIHQLTAREPTPEFAAAIAETCENLFLDLDDPRLREVAAMRMEGYADHEIAQRLNCTRSTVQRRLPSSAINGSIWLIPWSRWASEQLEHRPTMWHLESQISNLKSHTAGPSARVQYVPVQRAICSNSLDHRS